MMGRIGVCAKQDHEVLTREAQLAQARSKAESLRAMSASQPLRNVDAGDVVKVVTDEEDQVAEQLMTLLCGWVGAVNRRELLQLLGSAVPAMAWDCSTSPLSTDILWVRFGWAMHSCTLAIR